MLEISGGDFHRHRRSTLAITLAITAMFIPGVTALAGQPDLAGPAASGSIQRPRLRVKAADVGIQVLPQPIDLGGGVRFLGTGPSPSQIQAHIETNLNAADTTNADQLWTGGGLGLNLSGAGIVVGIWDAGAVRSTHQELNGRVTVVDPVGLHDHSTHVAGTIGALGVVPSAHGMANNVLIRSRDWNNDVAEMATDANLIQISSHSYGVVAGWSTDLDWGIGFTDTWFADRGLYAVESPDFGKYDFSARSLDGTLNANIFLLCCWAAGNDRGEGYVNGHGDNTYVAYFSTPPVPGTSVGSGYYQVPNSGATVAPPSDGNAGTGYDSINGMSLAKNCVTVGAINDQTADPYSSISIASFSGHGPVDDGRVKPDVVGNGVGLTSCVSSSDAAYASYSGTSMATPNIAGTTALIIEEYKNLNSGVLPRSATTKALLIHNAFDGGTIGPDYRYGWGLVDAARTVQFLIDSESASPVSNYLYEGNYTGSPQNYNYVYSGSGNIKATLVWTDPAPSGGAMPGAGVDVTTRALVRDLDLTIIGPGSVTYWPWTLDPANPTAPAVRTIRNTVDNVEQVVINAPTAGVYTVRVSNTGAVPSQKYSLLVSNLSNGVAPLINPIPASATICGTSYSSAASSLSQGSTPVTWSLDAGPPFMTINPGNGAVTWPNPIPAAAPYSITVRATNGIGFDTDTWLLTVVPGDFNGDGILNDLDIPDFVDHLIDVSNARPCAADVNLDTFVDGLDVQAFTAGL